MTCSAPLVDIFELLTMSTPRNPVTDTTEVSNPSSKAIIFEGAKFQSLWSHDPNETLDCLAVPGPFPGASKLSFILTIWEAIMLLPLVQGSTNIPAYLPNLTFATQQVGDLADRVLWKRLSHLFIQGVASLPGVTFVNPDTTARYMTESPVHVKAKCRIDDRHGLYFVRTFVHDIFLPFSARPCGDIDCDACGGGTGEPNKCGEIPIHNDLWMKMFYKVRG